MKEPITNGDSDRSTKGQFVAGNQASVGHKDPRSEKAKLFKKALIEAVTVDDIKDVITALVTKAKTGDVKAAKEVLDRCLGKPTEQHEHDVTGDLARFLEQIGSNGSLRCPREAGD